MKKKIAIGAIVIALVGYGAYKMNILGTTEVKVARIEVGDLSDMNLYTGMVVPGEIKPVYISAPAVIERILVKDGEEITKDTELILFSNKSIMENDKALRVNELDIQNVKLQIADLDSGSMKLELDNRELEIKNLEEKIKADMRRLPVVTEEARTLQKRAEAYMQLLSKDGVSATEASRINTESGRKQVELEDLKTNLELNRQKHQLMVVSYESLKRELNIEEAKLRSSLEKLELENETLKIREKQLKEPLTAGVDGVVVGIDVQEGSVTQPGERLLAVSTTGGNRVNVEVPLYQSSAIAKGQPAIIVSRDSDGDKQYKGKVEKVSTAAVDSKYSKTKEKVIQVEVSIDEENDLRPGFIADVEISGQAKTAVPVVNSFSVIEEDGEYFVYINDGGRARKQKVNVGARTVNSYEILDLPVGTQVIVNPFKVRNGEKIRVVE
ncbi:MAG: HlyD family efflux transporter periplasmic adaptor subunit [Fusobacterium mortiferum]|uniref:HlyD family efflux transporter periplasmic adaptor subunit n=1 Tax=Fusobacterium mortiferum TaxID=850 RepID=UPI0025D0D984|nr:HlyD family efflux transporter periplasmic adaptor subunit [uncultured Fusobacterium sp.]MCI7187215.1 HlyD family efflux transporter periplasmic adaptor subunit [Fusobacterium mortiferum]MDD7261766.1 HlyD family efflux transporter periplasmic adaptor subunit [Fusobacterium mortiferum]MDY2802284.1 HlyD family efflux transporter periplasmic adaptor subunit [Fusobacterium mortiferum]MDY5979791.1 HlyD family efflux transporter periplasmic adaptor subunit [Fusobacterium mortiferum]